MNICYMACFMTSINNINSYYNNRLVKLNSESSETGVSCFSLLCPLPEFSQAEIPRFDKPGQRIFWVV